MKLVRVILVLLLLVVPVCSAANHPAKIRIVFTTPSEDATGAIRSLISRFNSMQDRITVIHRPISSSTDDCHDYYVTAFMAHEDSFDVLSADIIWPPEFIASNWVEPLDRYVRPSELNQFLPMTVKVNRYQGHIYGIPWFTDTGLLYYRKDLVPKPPRTWDQLIAVSREKMQAKSISYGYVFQGNQYEGLICNALEFIWGNGGDVLDGNRVMINSPKAIQGLATMVKVVQSGICPPEVLSFQEEDGRLYFQDGGALFFRGWPNAWATMNQNDSKVKGRIGVSVLPAGPQGQSGYGTLGGWSLMINRNSKNKAAAMEFIKYMTGEEGQRLNAILSGRLPTRVAMYRDPAVLKANPLFNQMLPIVRQAKPRPLSVVYPALSDIMQSYFYPTLSGEIAPSEATAGIEAKFKATLKKEY